MKNRKLVMIDDAKVVGRIDLDEKAFAQEVVVPPSEQTSVNIPGRKCSHGVYIPANSPDENRAEYCTLCSPYKLSTKEYAAYAA